jgi:cytochrome c553
MELPAFGRHWPLYFGGLAMWQYAAAHLEILLFWVTRWLKGTAIRRGTRVWSVLGIAPILLCGSIARVNGQDQSTPDLLSRALVASPDRAHGSDLFERFCTHCHSSRGTGAGAREFPRLSGQQRLYLLNQLTQFISLDRYGPQMHQVLGQVADPQSLSDLSAYLAAQPTYRFGEHGDGHRLGLGRSIYNERCSQCHGLLGEGQAEGPIPAIGGQNYTYLLTQLKGFAAGHRSRAETNLIVLVRSLSADDMRAAADFMSRMPQSVDPHYGVVN